MSRRTKAKSAPAQLGERSKEQALLNLLAKLRLQLVPAHQRVTALYSIEDLRNDMREILQAFGEALTSEVGSIYVVNPARTRLHGLATHGYAADISDIEYVLNPTGNGEELHKANGKPGGGITAFVATTGKTLWFDQKEKVQAHPAHAGRIDSIQWTDGREFKNCGIIPLKVGSETIGVLKAENIESNEVGSVVTQPLRDIVQETAPLLAMALYTQRERLLAEERSFRVTYSRSREFEDVPQGHVVLQHLLTSICTSDVAYFTHDKDPQKLQQRLPLVLGHETIAIVRDIAYNQRYAAGDGKGEPITIGDRVVVIPQRPCGNCSVCKASPTGDVSEQGENYCGNVKHMASNADGSLRTRYRYWPDLLLRIPNELADELAVLTEPLAQLVQVWRELGFKEGDNGFSLNVDQFRSIPLNHAFDLPASKFNEYFRIFASDDQTPRACLRLPNSRGQRKAALSCSKEFNHYALMRRGLMLSALDKSVRTVAKESPKVLILGTGPLAYLAAVLLRHAYELPEESVYIYGRSESSLRPFEGLGVLIDVSDVCIGGKNVFDGRMRDWDDANPATRVRRAQACIIEELKNQQVAFDIVLECIGGSDTADLVDFGLRAAGDQGILALFGLWDRKIDVDFSLVLKKQITFKGFFRACRGSYLEALEYLRRPAFGDYVRKIVQEDPHLVTSALEMNQAFERASQRKNPDGSTRWGKVLVRLDNSVEFRGENSGKEELPA